MPYQKIIFVEGPDDMHAIRHLLNHHGINARSFDASEIEQDDVIAIQSLGGYPHLRKRLLAELKNSSVLQYAGVVVDADANASRRWISLSQRITEAGGQQVPAILPLAGWKGEVHAPDRQITIGTWLMPDNQSAGALEEFVMRLISPDDALWPYAEQCVEGLKDYMEAASFDKLPVSKARVHTWLAWQEKPGLPMGSAIRGKFLDSEAEQAVRFVTWVRDLFDL
jgi:hypothetical protein